MSRRIGLVSLVVADYDAAIAWYTDNLGFVLVEDTPLGNGKRWVVVAPRPDSETRLLLARAEGAAQEAAVGNQTGGRVFLFLDTDDFARDHARMVAKGGAVSGGSAHGKLWNGGRVRGSPRQPLGPHRTRLNQASDPLHSHLIPTISPGLRRLPSSSGPGRRPLTAETGVRFPLGVPAFPIISAAYWSECQARSE